MNKIQNYELIIDKAYNISSPLLLETALLQISGEKNDLLKELNNSGSIKVPVVGDFSSGKSSLLNCFIGRTDLLPVDITPETAVAYELCYGINEHVELYREGIKIEERPVDDIKQLSTRPGDIAKVYINSVKIKELEFKDITLVDMPGIDSGIKEHNDAILNYINKGTVFVLCVDCAGGSLRQSTIAFMSELAKYNLCPAVIVTKSDKKPAGMVDEIVEYISFQSRKVIGTEPFVGHVSAHNNDIRAFERFLNTLDSDKLVSEKFHNRIEQHLGMHISALVTQSNIYQTDIADAEQKIVALEKEKLAASETINNANVGDTPEKSTQDVLDLVDASLRVHSAEIAQMVIDKEDSSAINARILNYIRPTIVLAFKEEGEQYAYAMNTVVDNVSTALQNNLSIDGNLFDNLVDSFRDDIVGGISIAADVLIAMPNVFAKALGWVLQFLGDKVPDLIKWFLGKSKDDLLMEVTEKVESSVIPQILDRLRPEIMQQITDQQQRIRENINVSITSSIGNMQDSVMASKEMGDKKEKEEMVQRINVAINSIKTLKGEI